MAAQRGLASPLALDDLVSLSWVQQPAVEP